MGHINNVLFVVFLFQPTNKRMQFVVFQRIKIKTVTMVWCNTDRQKNRGNIAQHDVN